MLELFLMQRGFGSIQAIKKKLSSDLNSLNIFKIDGNKNKLIGKNNIIIDKVCAPKKAPWLSWTPRILSNESFFKPLVYKTTLLCT